VVGVPIVEVVNTPANWIRWMACSYVGLLGTKNDLLEVGVPLYLGLAIPQYIHGPANLVGLPRCVTFQGRCALLSPASLLRTPRILRRE
jgi:hypothetical protein